MNGQAIRAALGILAPIVGEVAEYIDGGERTPKIAQLPDVLQSEIELARAEIRAEKKNAPRFNPGS